ncbi:hypothetical protein CRE_29481 [Caenorhabditis remanei]|uniref:Uncharacterized protein n=1 Tax=Caenorhabditis remanei TaxID=31234 RepID=E3LVA2_CAERE|nr:hypothetical protein CRE_29481 [Caenorhabditis remanei]
MDDFYVTLPSNVPNAPFPNTSSRYVTRLPEVLQLRKDKWMVALTDLVYPHSFVNVGKPLYYWIHFKSGRQPIRITFPSAQYLNLEQILQTLNTKTRAKRSANVELEDVSKAKRAVELSESDQNLLDLVNNRVETTPGDTPEGAPGGSEGAPGVSLTIHQQQVLDTFKKGRGTAKGEKEKGEKPITTGGKSEEKTGEKAEDQAKGEKAKGDKAEGEPVKSEEKADEPVKSEEKADEPVKSEEKTDEPAKSEEKAEGESVKSGDKAKGDKTGGEPGIILSEESEELLDLYNSGQNAEGGKAEETGSSTPQNEKTGETKDPVLDETQKDYLALLEEEKLKDEKDRLKKEAEERAKAKAAEEAKKKAEEAKAKAAEEAKKKAEEVKAKAAEEAKKKAEEAKKRAEQEATDAEKNRTEHLLALVNNAIEVQNTLPEYKIMLETIKNRPGDITTYNELLEEFQKLRSIVSIDGNLFDVTPYVRFSDEHGRVKVDFLHSDVYFLEFEKPFSYFLGFDDMIVRNNSTAPHKVDLFGDVSVIYLYSDVVEPIIVGNKKTNLLSVIPCTGQYGSVVYYTVPNPRYVPIINSTIDSIRIELLTDGGTPIPFSWGTTISVLHFKRLKL